MENAATDLSRLATSPATVSRGRCRIYLRKSKSLAEIKSKVRSQKAIVIRTE